MAGIFTDSRLNSSFNLPIDVNWVMNDGSVKHYSGPVFGNRAYYEPDVPGPANILDSVTSYRTGRSATPEQQYNAEIQEMLRDTNPETKHDIGHEFDLRRRRVVHWDRLATKYDIPMPAGNLLSASRYQGPLGFFGFNYNPGDVGLQGNLFGLQDLFEKVPDVPISKGTTAIARCSPTKSEASLAAAILELRDGLPKVPLAGLKRLKTVRDIPRMSSEEFLNYVFGVLPTVSDVKSIFVAMVNARKIISQYTKDSDKLVRRRYKFKTEYSNQSWTSEPSKNALRLFAPGSYEGSNVSNNMDYFGSSSGLTVTRLLTKSDKIWFSGAFRYHLSSDSNVFGRIDRTGQLAGKLLGARLDASALWQAMPWSWLVDWFTDVGDLITNGTQSALDGQLLQYGYLMQDSTYINTYTVNNFHTYYNGIITNLTTAFVSQRKQRVKATPYGFGVSPDSLTDQQWSILGALGMTRAPKSLW